MSTRNLEQVLDLIVDAMKEEKITPRKDSLRTRLSNIMSQHPEIGQRKGQPKSNLILTEDDVDRVLDLLKQWRDSLVTQTRDTKFGYPSDSAIDAIKSRKRD